MRLLNYDGEVHPGAERNGHLRLAELAEVVHRNAPLIAADDLEQAVMWLKHWKQQQPRPTDRKHPVASRNFAFELQRLKESPSQQHLQRSAWLKSLSARFAFAVCMLLFIAALAVQFLASSPLVVASFSIAGVGCFIWSEHLVVASLTTAKKQDRQYFSRSLYAATSVDEMGAAGWFSHLPGLDDRDFISWSEAGDKFLSEIDRLRDVAYHDPEYLVENQRAAASLATKLQRTAQVST